MSLIWIFLFWTFHINGMIKYVVLTEWLLWLSIVSEFIHVMACVSLNCQIIFHCIVMPRFVYYFINKWTFVSTFWLLWTVKLWTFLYTFLCGCAFSFLLCNTYLWLELLIICWETAGMFSKVAVPFFIY